MTWESALSKYQQKRLERKQQREADRQRKRAQRRKERLDRIAEQKEIKQQKDQQQNDDNYDKDVRFINSEFIKSFKYEHEEDDILYSPNYAVFMAKSGADISELPIEMSKTQETSARAAGIPGSG